MRERRGWRRIETEDGGRRGGRGRRG